MSEYQELKENNNYFNTKILICKIINKLQILKDMS